ncbi:MAG: AhpC/TSA family protein [Bacteroidia bacterium]|nr:AhpC/TSA family protein [Bacteroidia bacterium]
MKKSLFFKKSGILQCIIFIIFNLLMFVSCHFEPEGFILEGQIKNASGKKIYLENYNKKTKDSAFIDKEGNFSFNGMTTTPNFFNLYFDPNSPVLLIVDSLDRLKITADVNDLFGTCRVSGSADAELLSEMRIKFAENYYRLKTIPPPTQEDSDSVKLQKYIMANTILKEHKEYLIEYVKKHPSSLAVSFDARNYVLTPETDYELFKMVDDSLTKKYPDSKHTKMLHANIIEAKRKIDLQAMQPQNINSDSLAPNFSLPDPSGKIITLSSLRGNYVLLDFWASWCRPCRMENPFLVTAYNKYHKKGFEIFQVSLDGTKDAWLKGIGMDNLGNWLHGSDLKEWQSTPARLYGVNAIPANFLIDKQGEIIARDLRGAALETRLAEIFK